jgi:hypothetical protein
MTTTKPTRATSSNPRNSELARQLLIRPDREFAAAGSAKVEAVAAGKFENVFGDLAAKIDRRGAIFLVLTGAE